ncbi:MAG: hypothetical protein FWD87_10810 [Spirochaetaceae bacterium]|nr:hypothetical protein [Spirochaetaceae bacterium]
MSEAHNEPLTFEKVWAALMEDRERMKELREQEAERQKEAARQTEELKKQEDERWKKAARQTKELKKQEDERWKKAARQTEELKKQEDERWKKAARQTEELKKQIKETGRQIGKLGNRFGELAEHLVVPGIVKKFSGIGLNFYKVSTRGGEFADPETRQVVAEVDIVLENKDTFMAVEVKSKLQKQDVDDHIARMKTLRRIADDDDKRKYLGAVAGAIVTDEARNYARKSGFYVLEQSGDTMKLVVPKGFVPREW